MSDIRAIAEAIETRREQHPPQSSADAASYLQQDDLASLLLRPKCQFGDLRLLLRRRFPHSSDKREV
jgi:hypothetical protein